MLNEASPIPISPRTVSPPALPPGGTLICTAAADDSITENRIQSQATTSPQVMWSPAEVHVGGYQSKNLHLPDDSLARKRSGLWHHEARNNAIAAIAMAFVTGDLESLWPFGLFLGRQYTPINVPFLRPGWLAIVVEVPEHARALSALLPDFTIRQAYASYATPWSPRMIVTLAAMAEFETFMPTVLINTVGGRYALSLPGYDHRTQDNLGAIIELEDEFDERARQETNRRLLQYGAHRWPVFTRAGLMIDPATIPSRSRTRRTAYQRRVGCWRADSEGAG